MQQIILESGVGKKLVEATGQAIVCDEQGRVLGLFSPILGRPAIGDLQLEPPLSISQIEELRKNRSGKPLEEILGRLGY
jgi:hypothetical protein